MCFSGPGLTEVINGLLDTYGPLFTLPAHDPLLRQMKALAEGENTVFNRLEAFQFYNLLIERLIANKQAEDKRDNNRITAALKILDKQALNAAELALAAGLSREHFSREFTRIMGETVHKYLLQRKMQLACRLLNETGDSAEQVALRLGWSSGSNFGRAFKRETGYSPREYKTKNKQ